MDSGSIGPHTSAPISLDGLATLFSIPMSWATRVSVVNSVEVIQTSKGDLNGFWKVQRAASAALSIFTAPRK